MYFLCKNANCQLLLKTKESHIRENNMTFDIDNL